jgi:hypothetical protein
MRLYILSKLILRCYWLHGFDAIECWFHRADSSYADLGWFPDLPAGVCAIFF